MEKYYRDRVEIQDKELAKLRKELNFVTREKIFYEVNSEFVHDTSKSVLAGMTISGYIFGPVLLITSSRISDNWKIGIITLLATTIPVVVKVFKDWKGPKAAFLKKLEDEKKEKELRNS